MPRETRQALIQGLLADLRGWTGQYTSGSNCYIIAHGAGAIGLSGAAGECGIRECGWGSDTSKALKGNVEIRRTPAGGVCQLPFKF